MSATCLNCSHERAVKSTIANKSIFHNPILRLENVNFKIETEEQFVTAEKLGK